MKIENLNLNQRQNHRTALLEKKSSSSIQYQDVGVNLLREPAGARMFKLVRNLSFGDNDKRKTMERRAVGYDHPVTGQPVVQKYVIENFLAPGTEEIMAGDNHYSMLTLNDDITTYIYKSEFEKGEAGDSRHIATVVAPQDFGKDDDFKLGFEVEANGKIASALFCEQPVTVNGETVIVQVKLQRPVQAEMSKGSDTATVKVNKTVGEVEQVLDDKGFKLQRPSFSGRSLSFAGNFEINPDLAVIKCYRPDDTVNAYRQFVEEHAYDLCTNETRGAYADRVEDNERDNFTSVLLAGGVGTRFVNAYPNPHKSNKPATTVASEYTFFDLATASIANAGLLRLDDLTTDFAAVDLRTGYGDTTGNPNSKVLMVTGTEDQHTAGATVAALRHNKIPNNHLLVAMADHVHNIDFSRAINAFTEDPETGLIIIAQPMRPMKTEKTFGLIEVAPDAFEGDGSYRDLVDVESFIEKPDDIVALHKDGQDRMHPVLELEGYPLPAVDEDNQYFKDRELALANTGIYVIHKDIARILGKMLDTSTMDPTPGYNEGTIKGLDYGGEFFPIMQKLLNPEDGREITKEALIDAVIEVQEENKRKKNPNYSIGDDPAFLARLDYIRANISEEEDIAPLRNQNLKMKTWIAQDKEGEPAKWHDLGNSIDYNNVMVEAAKGFEDGSWEHFAEKFREQVMDNVDTETGVVCQNELARKAFIKFMDTFHDFKMRGTVLVMAKDAD